MSMRKWNSSVRTQRNCFGHKPHRKVGHKQELCGGPLATILRRAIAADFGGPAAHDNLLSTHSKSHGE